MVHSGTPASGANPLAFLAGGGEMGERIRAFDWSRTPLGPIEGWPQSLRSALSICLNSNFPIALYWGGDLVLLYNDEWSPIPGEKHPWALGRPAREAWPEIWHIIEPLFGQVMTTGEATRSRDQLLPMHRHGFTEECYFDYTFSPIRGEGGQVEGVFNAVLETTTRVIGERRLRTLRELGAWETGEARTAEEACQTAASIIAENPHDLPFTLLYLLGDDGRATLAGLTGLGRETSASPAALALDAPDAPWPFRRVVETGKPVEVRDLPARFGPLPGGAWPESPHTAVVLPLAKSGQTQLAGFLVAGVSARLALNDDYRGFLDLLASHVATAVANARAYEEERRRAEALAELDRARTAFFSNVSHEFRTPLTLMLGPVEDLLARSHTDLPPAAAGQLEVVNRNGLRLLRLVNSLLDFSRIEAGRVRAVYQPTDLATFTADLASNFRAACERAGLRLVVDCPPLGEPAFVDREMWEKVVLNLVSNAFKFTFEGEIAISLRRAGTAAELRVRDTGTGIPAEEMPKLFERFHRIEKARGRTHEGSGIGLALVQELVRLHGGTIAAESVVGKGTTFTITVPLGSAHLPPDQNGEVRTTASTGTGATAYVEEALRWLPDEVRAENNGRGGLPAYHEPLPTPHRRSEPDGEDDRPRVLVADDNADMRQYVVRLLDEQFRVEAVPDGEAALRAARDRTPDLVLTDVMMPRLNGFGLLKELRADPRTSRLPVIMLSARAGEESRIEGVQAGADDYLVKPFSARELLARVSAHLQMARLRREANEAVRRSEERFRAFMSHSPATAYIKDEEGRYVFVNRLSEETFRRPLAEWVGRTDLDLFPPEQAEQYRENDRTVLASRMTSQFVEPVMKEDGLHHFLSFKFPLQDGEGRWLLAGMSLDITEKKRAEEELQQERDQLAVTLASIGDAVITTDAGGRITFLNGVAESLTGWANAEAAGRPLDGVFRIVNEQSRQPVENPASKALREGVVVGLANHTVLVAKDGTERPIDDSAAPVRDGEGHVVGCVLIFRDVTERRRLEKQRNVRLAVTHALGEAAGVDDGASAVLRAVCENLGWDMGFFWTANEDGSALACRRSWRRPGVPAGEFETASCSRTFTKGEGLPGRVWASGEPAWILDIGGDANFPRLSSAVDSGLHSAFACPVVLGHQALGVIEFFTRRIHEPDADLLEMMGTVAGGVGHFIERKTAEDELRRSEQELADFFENATVGLHWVGPDGTILRANKAELDMLGYSREEYVGRPIADFHADEDVICDILKRLQAGEKLAEYPARLKCKDGSLREVLIDSSVMWRDGSFVHTRCFTRDVTDRKWAEEALRHSEERFRSLMEQAPFSIQVFSPDGRTIRVNRAWEELWGVTLDQIADYNVLEDRQLEAKGVLSFIQRAFAGEPAFVPAIQYDPNETIPDRTRNADPVRWVAAVAYPLRDGQGAVREVVLVHEDITARRRAEAALRESEQRFRQLADAMPQIVWTAGPDGNIDYLNRRWTEFTGLPDTVGNEGWGQILHPDDARPAGERWAASLRSGAPFEMELRLLDRRRQGYRWHLLRTVAVPDGDGKVARWFGTGTDIHDQKRAEESARYLSEASAALAGVVDYESTLQKVANLAVPHFADWSAVDVADGGGTLRRLAVAHQDPEKVRLAHELMRDYPPDPHSPTGAFAVLRTGKPEMVREITDDLLVQGARDERHLDLIRSLGLKSFICVPLVVSGNTIGVLTFATAESGRTYADADLALAVDLANRASVAVENTQLYQALREADKRKDEFLATLAHELRNPLAPIRNALQILKLPRVDAATVGRSREMMERQVHHLVRLVDDLLDVSRVMRGKIELRKERVELASVVARAVETVQPLVDAQGHQLSVRLPPDSLLLDADPVRLAQVVGNLLTNAAKYTEPGGRIWLTAERDGDKAILRVRDTGIGIAPDMLPKIFELFVQADHATTKAQGGLGIGLTLVKNLVEMHKGTVEARSTGLGKGSEFVVRLPLTAQAIDQDQAGEAGQQAPSPAASGYRLLVVDDNQDAADSLATLLRLQGHEVRVAFSGPAALEMTKNYTPDVVFLDIGMPGMDGYEVARRLRQQSGLEKAVLAALTGWGQQEDRRRTAEAGFDHHLVKPPDPTALEGVLAGLERRNR